MNNTIKLFFDECVGEPQMRAMGGLLQTGQTKPDFKHIVEFQRAGIKDIVWLPLIANEGWIVMTADRGRRSKGEKREEKLPYLCRLHHITHIMLSSKVHHLKGLPKTLAIMEVWPGILLTPSSMPGTRFCIRFNNSQRVMLVNLDEENEHKTESAAIREVFGGDKAAAERSDDRDSEANNED